MKEKVLAYDFSLPPGTAPKELPPIEIHPKERRNNMGYSDNNSSSVNTALAVILGVLGFIMFIALLMWGMPIYNVWKSELQGKAELVRAEQNRKIKIQEAQANLEAEKLNAEAEVERAKGAARAIEIENGKLTDTYIKYLYIRQLSLADVDAIYIPTEAGIPVMEATRRLNPDRQGHVTVHNKSERAECKDPQPEEL
jgi:hypothetical protein